VGLTIAEYYAFIHTYRPVLDGAPFRAFDTTADYRRWCEENLPDWLGYTRPGTNQRQRRAAFREPFHGPVCHPWE